MDSLFKKHRTLISQTTTEHRVKGNHTGTVPLVAW